MTLKLAAGGRLTAGLGENLDVDCTTKPTTGGGNPAPGGEDAPGEPGEDAPDPEDGGDDESSDDPAAEDAGEANEDEGPEAAVAQDPEEEDGEDFDESAFDREFENDFSAGETDCGTSALKVGARVHEATVTRTASGPVLVAITLR